jgi:hypothetical protein
MKKDLMLDFLFVFFLTIVFMVSMWMVDISLAGLLTNRPLVSILNIDVDPNFTYHAGIMLGSLCFFVVVSLLFYFKFDSYRKWLIRKHRNHI